MWPLTETQIDAIKRLDKVISMRDGSADECHDYYCPYNIGMLIDHVNRKDYRDESSKYLYGLPPTERCTIDKDGTVHEEDHGIYHGKPDGFDSVCPRFVCVDRATGKWDCLCGLEVIARLLGVSVKALYEELRPRFDSDEILGYNPTWRKVGGSEWLKDGMSG